MPFSKNNALTLTELAHIVCSSTTVEYVLYAHGCESITVQRYIAYAHPDVKQLDLSDISIKLHRQRRST